MAVSASSDGGRMDFSRGRVRRSGDSCTGIWRGAVRGTRWVLREATDAFGDGPSEPARRRSRSRGVPGPAGRPVPPGARAGIACDGGIIVDAYAMTNDPDVLAIGDATTRPIFRQGRLGRVESIPSVTEQARQASSTILGSLPPPSELPWFWSDQFDLKLKMAGAVRPDAQVVVRDEKVKNRFALFHHEKGRVIAVETANHPAAFIAAKHLIAHETRVDIENLGNPSVDFRDLVGT